VGVRSEMHGEVRFRDAVAQDAELITEFQLAMALETESLRLDPATCAAGVRAVFTNLGRGRYFVADQAGSVIASLLVTYEWSDWRNGTIWWMQSVYVRPQHRRRGVFTGLYRHVHALAEADLAVQGLRLYVEAHNSTAQAVYARLGMTSERYSVCEWMKTH
jgi:GNAT superfamily N-acetyltransferase